MRRRLAPLATLERVEALEELNRRYNAETAPFDNHGRELGHQSGSPPYNPSGNNYNNRDGQYRQNNTSANDARSSTGKMPRSHYNNKEYEQRAREQTYYNMQQSMNANRAGGSHGGYSHQGSYAQPNEWRCG